MSESLRIPKLESGMIVVTKNKNVYLVLTNCLEQKFALVRPDGFMLSESYDRNLKAISGIDEFDIVKIYQPLWIADILDEFLDRSFYSSKNFTLIYDSASDTIRQKIQSLREEIKKLEEQL